MNLTPREKDKLLVAMAAIVARRRLERGVKLNHPESIALITDFVVEGGHIRGVITTDGGEIRADSVILATGHSARDIYQLLSRRGILLEPKPFAVGFRIEHHSAWRDDDHQVLGARPMAPRAAARLSCPGAPVLAMR